MNSAPWTEIGRCQQDIGSIKNELHRKVDSHEIYEINRRLDNLEHTMREICSTINGISFAFQTYEDKLTELTDELRAGDPNAD